MPEKKTKERALKAKREGKAPTTQAGEFVREEIHHVREGKHRGSTEQAIAIGLSKARRAGIAVPAQGKATKKKGNQKRSRSTAKPTKRASKKRKTRSARG